MKQYPTLKELREVLYLDSTIPQGLRWKIQTNPRAPKDNPVGSEDKDGYYRFNFKYVALKNHRVIFAIYNNCELNELPKVIDHIDTNVKNNDCLNLRSATHSQNKANRKAPQNNTSGYKGVTWCVRDSKWATQITFQSKTYNLGRYPTKEEAAKVYNDASYLYFGEFAYNNP